MLTMIPAEMPPGAVLLLLLAGIVIVDLVVGLLFPAAFGRALPDLPGRSLSRGLVAVEKRLNRAGRSAANRLVRGAALVVVVVIAAIVAGWVLEIVIGALSRHLPPTVSDPVIMEAVVVFFIIGQRHALAAGGQAARLLRRDRAGPARALLQSGPGVRVAGEDHHAVARAAVNRSTTGFAAALVGRLFWYLLAGLPGLLAVIAVQGTARALATAREGDFAQAALRLDAVLQFLPERLAALALWLATPFVPSASPAAGLGAFFRAGTALAVIAAALGLALDGAAQARPKERARKAQRRHWIGTGRARAQPADIARCRWLVGVASLWTVVALAAAFLWIGS